MRSILSLGLLFCLLAVEVYSEDMVCEGGTQAKSVTLNTGDTFAFTTKGRRYKPNMDCSVTYTLGTCTAAKMTCKPFSTQGNKRCTKGDILTVTDDNGPAKFCRKKAPNGMGLVGDFTVSFTSDGRRQSRGFKCNIECADDGGSGGSTSGGSGGTTNNQAYCDLNAGHTMCIYPGPSDVCSSKTIFRQMSADAKTAVLNKHNELRSKVALGNEAGQPAAANMMKLVWDDELELIAQRLADQCTFKHDDERGLLDGTSVGQNLYMGQTSQQQDETVVQGVMDASVQAWYDEVTSPGFNSGNINPFSWTSGTGHYTQVVWAATTRIGCGVVYYLESVWYTNLIVCNYAVAGNLIGSTMYIEGTACSQCPSGATCENGLCVV